MQYTVLTPALSTKTLGLVFTNEMDFVKKHRYLFLEQHPEIIFAINNDSVIVNQLTTIHEMMEQVKKIEEQEKQNSVIGASLTGSHR
jgi:hypothetical protein